MHIIYCNMFLAMLSSLQSAGKCFACGMYSWAYFCNLQSGRVHWFNSPGCRANATSIVRKFFSTQVRQKDRIIFMLWHTSYELLNSWFWNEVMEIWLV